MKVPELVQPSVAILRRDVSQCGSEERGRNLLPHHQGSYKIRGVPER